MSISPADMRPGQRVRITWHHAERRNKRAWSHHVEGRVRCANERGIVLRGWGFISAQTRDVYTQTIEVIE